MLSYLQESRPAKGRGLAAAAAAAARRCLPVQFQMDWQESGECVPAGGEGNGFINQPFSLAPGDIRISVDRQYDSYGWTPREMEMRRSESDQLI